jgi:hypothetical protein
MQEGATRAVVEADTPGLLESRRLAVAFVCWT